MGPLLPSLLLAAALGGPGDKPLPDLTRLRPGATTAEVVQVLGPPKRVARQIIYKRCLEQWIYDAPFALHLEFDCIQGRQAQMVGGHLLPSLRP